MSVYLGDQEGWGDEFWYQEEALENPNDRAMPDHQSRGIQVPDRFKRPAKDATIEELRAYYAERAKTFEVRAKERLNPKPSK